MTKTYLWSITPKTNLHVGDENVANFSLVDKMVQRDILTTLPCIHSSSLKGALSEFVSANFKDSDGVVKTIFGSDNSNPDDSQKGTHAFFDAHLLFLPVPSDWNLFFRATSVEVLKHFLGELEIFGIEGELKNTLKTEIDKLTPLEGKPTVFIEANNEEEIRVGGLEANKLDKNGNCSAIINLLERYFGEHIALFSNRDFKELCNDENLPIIARNKLDKGESKNLWYEQVVPRESVFYTFILEKGDVSLKEKLKNQDNLIQIGANATIGYGYCELKLMGSYEK